MAEKNYWQWFCSSLFYAPGLEHKLLEKYGTPERVFHSKEQKLTESFPSNQEKLTILAVNRKKWDFNREAERLQRLNLTFLSIEDPRYPKRLGTIPDAPCGLFVRGKLPEEEKPAVAIVGARDCTTYGRNLSQWFGGELAAAGVQILSGMARGIDAYSHYGALKKDGATFAVLAGGADMCYPESNRDIYMELERRGGIISECPPGVRPLKYYFPLRNRILSGMSDLVLIIEAREKSGSLITADYGLEQGKEVYAAPGPLGEALSAGCNNLIRQGAGIAISPEQLLEVLHILPGFNRKKMQENKIVLERSENLVYSCLRLQAQSLAEICAKTGLTPGETLSIMTKLQMKGYAKEVYKNYYTLS